MNSANNMNKSGRKGIRKCIYMARDLKDDISRIAILDNRSFSAMADLLWRKGLAVHMEGEGQK